MACRLHPESLLAVTVDGADEPVHVWIGEGWQRVECTFAPGEEVRIPHGLLQNLHASEVLLAVFTERAGRTTTGLWDVDWRIRNVEVAAPIALEDHTE